jgi:hypothetical protein
MDVFKKRLADLEHAWEGRKDLDGQLAELRDAIATLHAMILEQGQRIAALRAALGQ